jgi:apolipoprotein D and lipocalin family protein
MKKLIILLSFCFISACTSVPEGIKPVAMFELDRYLGKWYEIARIENRFEAGLDNVTATYSLNDDGSVNVLNQGYNAEERAWKAAEGRAVFVGADDVGHLKVSFFGPFYSSYVVYELDHKSYQYAFVTGYNREYLWFLSRTPTVDKAQVERFIQQAKSLGYNTSEIVFPNHSK